MHGFSGVQEESVSFHPVKTEPRLNLSIDAGYRRAMQTPQSMLTPVCKYVNIFLFGLCEPILTRVPSR